MASEEKSVIDSAYPFVPGRNFIIIADTKLTIRWISLGRRCASAKIMSACVLFLIRSTNSNCASSNVKSYIFLLVSL